MSDRTRYLFSALAILAVALVVWLPTIGWGLPSRDADKYLFGDRRPWTGKEIIALTATTQPTNAMRGADVDADPILDRSKPVILNDTDAKRAAIVRRYRLMSGQPDEFIQFKALSEMASRSGLAKLDPRLYQYGGLWMYPVGALVRTAMLVGYIETPPPGTPAIEFYLDHPEAFGKFYVVARFYSWCWGVVAAFAIAWIARRVTDSIGLATLAAVAFMLLPVTRTATHEAKPHLAGAALCLCAVIAATRYVEAGKRRWLIGAGALCGAAMAMVVSMLLACAVLPTMVWLRWRETFAQRAPRLVADETPFASANPRQVAGLPAPAIMLITSLAIAAIVYVATNPFVLINAIAHPEILRSNLGNSTAMYSPHRAIDALRDAIRIAADGMTATILILGLIATASVARRFRSTPLVLLGSVATLVAIQFVALSAGKPAEYARFAIVIAAFAVIAVVRIVAASRDRQLLIVVATIGAIGCLEFALMITTYDKVAPRRNKYTIAEDRKTLAEGSPLRLGMFHEPAPWSAPAFDLFRSQVLLVPSMEAANVDRLIWPANLDRETGRRTGCESLDWRENVFVDQIATKSVSSSSRPAADRPAE